MKGFFLGIVATIVGGVLLWFATDMASTWKNSRSQVLQYKSGRYENRILVTKQIKEEISKVEPGDILNIVRIENVGSEELDNLSFSVQNEYRQSGNPIAAIGVLQNIPSDGASPKLTLTDDGAKVDYGLLRRNEGVVLWARSRDVGALKIRSNRKGLQLVDETYSDTSKLEGWSILITAIVAIVSLVIGIAIAEYTNRSVWRKIGFDPKEVDQAYLNAIKKK